MPSPNTRTCGFSAVSFRLESQGKLSTSDNFNPQTSTYEAWQPHWPCLGLSGLFWASLGFSKPFWVLGFPGPFWAFLGFSGLLWAFLGFSGIPWAILGLPGPFKTCAWAMARGCQTHPLALPLQNQAKSGMQLSRVNTSTFVVRVQCFESQLSRDKNSIVVLRTQYVDFASPLRAIVTCPHIPPLIRTMFRRGHHVPAGCNCQVSTQRTFVVRSQCFES